MSNHVFRSLHQGPALLLLPNAWDAVTARLIESLGAKAIATTSAGLAWSRGYPDGNALPDDQLIAATCDIARVIRVPLTVDIEAGYSDDPRGVARLVARVVAAGAVGINIEDGAGSPDLLCKKLAAIRETVANLDVDLFINARTDVYLRDIASGAAAVEEIIHRASRYHAAGCDGLFVPGLANTDAMEAIAAAVLPMPLNIMAVPNLPPMEMLQKHGVRRLSAGSAIAQAALGCTRQLAADFLAGTMSEMFGAAAQYSTVNQLFANIAHE
ncbi:MAG TPA: isocitrate lyase/phosphoenolpyruvate mutase family protein [Steroidobacteraceae bacterium]|nr:isocitrate lyase/phosphoenolpyruvate mutase family protein [Steroidobacteraceae bacterium]